MTASMTRAMAGKGIFSSRNELTATSFAAFMTAGMVPPALPAS